MTCRRSDQVDRLDYLVNPRDPAYAEFRIHYPTCSDCSRAVARWTRWEEIARSAVRGPGPEHPAEELLLTFQTSPETLSPEDRDSVRLHLEGCSACRNDLAALDSFDFATLRRGYAEDTPSGSVLPAERRGPRSAPRKRMRWLSRSIPAPALAAALLLVVAIPSALALWWMVSERGIRWPSDAGVARSDHLAATDTPMEPAPQPQFEAPPAPTPGPVVVQETPSEDAPDADSPTGPQPPRTVEDTVPKAPEKIAEEDPAPAREEEPEGILPQVPLPQEPDTKFLSGGVLVIASLDPPSYSRPPGGESRARFNEVLRHDRTDLPTLRALVPYHTALTLRESPVLYWFISKGTDLRLDLTMVDEQSVDPVLEVTLDTPVEAGIHAVDLSEHGVKLKPGVPYKWFISLSVDHKQRPYDISSRGVIQRVEPSEALQRELGTGDPAQRGHTLAANGIWYDALAFFSKWIERNPGDAKLREQRTALLQEVGLEEVADYERRLQSEASSQ